MTRTAVINIIKTLTPEEKAFICTRNSGKICFKSGAVIESNIVSFSTEDEFFLIKVQTLSDKHQTLSRCYVAYEDIVMVEVLQQDKR